MAQTGYTPISIYYSATAAAAPTAGNLVAGELAINTNDGVLYYKDSSGVVQSIASKAGNSGSFTNLAYTGTLTGGTGVVNLGSGQFYKDASGNVGIGTASPAAKLNVTGHSSNIGAIFDKGATTQYGINYKNSAQTYTQYVDINNNGTNYWTLYDTTNAQIVTQYVPGASGSNAFYTAGTERMRIDSSGNLLVGTTSSSGKATINAGTSSATTYNTVSRIGGSSVTSQQQSTSVSTTATVILTPNLYASFCVVFGSDGTNRFMDLILCTLGSGTVQIVASSIVSGVPAVRVYDQSGSAYRLAMASGTYTVQVSATSMSD